MGPNFLISLHVFKYICLLLHHICKWKHRNNRCRSGFWPLKEKVGWKAGIFIIIIWQFSFSSWNTTGRIVPLIAVPPAHCTFPPRIICFFSLSDCRLLFIIAYELKQLVQNVDFCKIETFLHPVNLVGEVLFWGRFNSWSAGEVENQGKRGDNSSFKQLPGL